METTRTIIYNLKTRYKQKNKECFSKEEVSDLRYSIELAMKEARVTKGLYSHLISWLLVSRGLREVDGDIISNYACSVLKQALRIEETHHRKQGLLAYIPKEPSRATKEEFVKFIAFKEGGVEFVAFCESDFKEIAEKLRKKLL